MKFQSIGLLGCGNMGSAFLQAITSRFPEVRLYAFDIDKDACASVAAEPCASEEEVAKHSDVVLLAVKPQIIAEVARKLSKLPDGRYISLAAGVCLSELKHLLNTQEVVRFMPTVAALAGSSPVAVCWDTAHPPSWHKDALEIAQAAGSAYVLPEQLISGFIGVSASGIAYVFQFLHALALGGTKTGLSYDQSFQLAKETMAGAVALLEQTGRNPSEAVSSVISPGGTTIDGIFSLESKGFTAAVMEAVASAADKSDALTKKR